MTVPLGDRLAGAVWGHLVGDALGVPYEFRPASRIGEVRWGESGTHRQPPGTWSDDGGLMLALLDSLLSRGFDLDDQARRALAWRRDGAYRPGELFDIGGTTAQALDRVARGVRPEECGGSDEGDNGNGSLMRILPVALVERDVSDAVLVEHAMRASAVTHAHLRSRLCCALYCLLVRRLLGGAVPEDAMRTAIETLRRPAGDAAADELELITAYPWRTGSGYVVDSLWSAWDAFAGAGDYADAVQSAIQFGNDTDTTACVAGGLAGARWGVASIPGQWLEEMRGQEIVQPLVARLVGGVTP